MPIIPRRLFLYACLAVAVAVAVSACAVRQTAVVMAPVATSEYTLVSAAELQLNTGYRRSLKPGSRWTRIGHVPQGDVYKPVADVFTVEGAHIHEAYLVVEGDSLAGFYLPAENSYSALDQKIKLHFTTTGTP
jgi:methionine aminopeptidase